MLKCPGFMFWKAKEVFFGCGGRETWLTSPSCSRGANSFLSFILLLISPLDSTHVTACFHSDKLHILLLRQKVSQGSFTFQNHT
jgi:hypothetical protein